MDDVMYDVMDDVMDDVLRLWRLGRAQAALAHAPLHGLHHWVGGEEAGRHELLLSFALLLVGAGLASAVAGAVQCGRGRLLDLVEHILAGRRAQRHLTPRVSAGRSGACSVSSSELLPLPLPVSEPLPWPLPLPLPLPPTESWRAREGKVKETGGRWGLCPAARP